MKTISQLKNAVKKGKTLIWVDPDPIEGVSYKIDEIIGLDAINEIFFYEDELITIKYNNNSNEAEVYLYEIKVKKSTSQKEKIITEKQILKNKIVQLNEECTKYKKGFDILYEYFDSISDEEKPIVDQQLKELGL